MRMRMRVRVRARVRVRVSQGPHRGVRRSRRTRYTDGKSSTIPRSKIPQPNLKGSNSKNSLGKADIT